MRILFVSDHCCARVVKEGLALQKLGLDIVYIQRRIANSCFTNVLPTCSFYEGPDQLAQKLSHFRNRCDLVHVHNEPDWLARVAKRVLPDKPLVFDAHDLFSVRIQVIDAEESYAFRESDAFVYPSIGYKEWATDIYRMFGINDKPNIVIHSMPNEDWIIEEENAQIRSLVYEGGLRVKEEVRPEHPEAFKYHEYRDFRKLFGFLNSIGIPVVVYPGNSDALDSFRGCGATINFPLEYFDLVPALSRYRYGLAGGPIHTLQWDWAMPHKLFEYIGSGIPVIGFNSDNIKSFIEKHEVGVYVDSWNDIPRVFNDDALHAKLKANVLNKRKEFTMEREIKPLLNIYKELLG